MLIFHKDGTLPTTPNTIFVFGSNLAGRHGAGAAKVAHDMYGAQRGVGVGVTGMSYAIPTKSHQIHTLSVDIVAKYVNQFIEDVVNSKFNSYFITNIGCGLAGIKQSDMLMVWKHAISNAPDVNVLLYDDKILSFPMQLRALKEMVNHD